MFLNYQKSFGEPINWDRVKYFTPLENWGNVTLICPDLIYELDYLRTIAGVPILITCGTQGTHVKNSYHFWKKDPKDTSEMPKGLAVDIIFPTLKLKDIPEMFLLAQKLRFQGLGIYSWWSYKKKRIGGMHLDIRPTLRRATWLSTQKGLYIGANFENMSFYFRQGRLKK